MTFIIDLSADTWRDNDPAATARRWLLRESSMSSSVVELLGIDDLFMYDAPGYESTLLSLVMTATGHSDKRGLFKFPEGLSGDLDLIGDGEGIIEFVRYALYVPFESVFRSAGISSAVTELDDTMDDRGLSGIDAAVDILMHAATEFATLIGVYQSIDHAFKHSQQGRG